MTRLPKLDDSDRSCVIRVGTGISSPDAVPRMKTFRLHLPVIDTAAVEELLDLVTKTEGVVGALLDAATATLHVVVSRDASALLVREQLLSVAA
jgi:hypothetical protein